MTRSITDEIKQTRPFRTKSQEATVALMRTAHLIRRQAEAVEEQRSLRTVAQLTVQAELHMSKGEYEAAIDVFKEAIAVRRDRVSPLRLADALVSAKRLEDAAGLLQNSAGANSRPEIYRRLADVYAALGRTEDSAAMRRTYVEKRLQELATAADP